MNLVLATSSLLVFGSGPGRPAVLHHPHDPIDALAISPDFVRDRTLFVASHESMNVFLVSRNGGRTFTESRDGLIGVAVADIEFASDWRSSGTVYCAIEWAGIQRSTDRGRTWQPPLTRRAVRNMGVVPTGPDGRHDLFYTTDDTVWRWNDGDEKETMVWRSPSTVIIADVAISPNFRRDLTLAIVSTDGNVRVTNDAGETWRELHVDGEPTELSFSPAYTDDRTLWLATNGGGLLRSTDGGRSFSRSRRGLAPADINDVRASGDGRTVWVATRRNGVFVSTDHGESWSPRRYSVSLNNQSNKHYRIVRPSPTCAEDHLVFCGMFEGLYVSDDDGLSWQKRQIKPPHLGRLLSVAQGFLEHGTVFGAGYGMHILCSVDRGATWRLRATDYPSRSTYSIAVSPDFKNDRLLLCGCTGYVMISRDLGETWRRHDLPLAPDEAPPVIWGLAYSPDFRDDRVIYATGDGALFRSDDAGENWRRFEGIAKSRAIVISPDFARDRTLFLGADTIYRSTDGGHTKQALPCPQRIDSLVIAPDFATSNELYATGKSRDAFFRSSDRGSSWDRKSEGLGGEAPFAIACAADEAGHPILLLSTMGGGLFRSDDRGDSWHLLSRPGAGFSLAASPSFAADHTLFLGIYAGLARSEDGGESWALTTPTAVCDTDRQPWTRAGQWDLVAPGRTLGYGAHQAGEAGANMAFSFVGVGLRLIGCVGPDHGRARVTLDNDTVEIIDCFAEQPRSQVVLAEFDGLPRDLHQLRIQVLGTRGSRSSGTVVTIDAAETVHGSGNSTGTLLPTLPRLSSRTVLPAWLLAVAIVAAACVLWSGLRRVARLRPPS